MKCSTWTAADNTLALSITRKRVVVSNLGLPRQEAQEPDPKAWDRTPCRRRTTAVFVGVLLAVFLALQFLLPLRTAVKIGADEDFELSKATLILHGYQLYSQIWNDQPPLNTFLIVQVLKHVSLSVLGPRLLSVGFSCVLLACFFLLVHRGTGLLSASVGTALLIASPGFIELSSSCMQEIPALSPIVAAVYILRRGRPTKLCLAEVLSGLVFGFGLQMKLIGVVYLPLVALSFWLWYVKPAALRHILRSSFAFGIGAVIAFITLNCLTGSPLAVQLQQAWAAHFASAKWFEYGSPAERVFDWSVLLKNWDTTILAFGGFIVLLAKLRRRPDGLLPLVWMGLTLIVFPTHKPWWSYYYIHNALPLCWCAGVACSVVFQELRSRRTWRWATIAGLFAISASAWMSGRVYLQEVGIRSSLKLDACLVLKEIQRFKPFTTFLYADQPIYSFHSDIPMPPHLAVISLKRFWTGEMSNARLLTELETTKPGLILRDNDGREVPYQAFLDCEYRLVYQDASFRLFAHHTISKKPQQ